ncbi:hypothetical protein N7532_008720 [Penicillium argentinense]|uniref:Oxidoreductase n=1 Tax=Penicillium argentinense TaxID=1131581 RepID=A0A9W9EY53_9EURO|nr:uncharacterized protein N7532_008720 [Penicillium argentinense]KAJ5090036.1 hypothetical protein N7532_008720 [Penicillium argentinense]
MNLCHGVQDSKITFFRTNKDTHVAAPNARSQCLNPDNDVPDLTGKTIFITGGTNGLGAESVILFAKHKPAHIYISGRNAKTAEKTIQRVRDAGSSTEVTFVECNLASLVSVKQAGKLFAAFTTRLDILICSAGIMAQTPGLTTDGYEIQFGANHLGHALLIKKLLPLLENRQGEDGDRRIVILTSQGARIHPSGGILFDNLRTVQNDFFVGGPIITISIHPGVVSTGLVDNLGFLDRALIYSTSVGRMLKPEQGAYNQVWAATAPREEIQNWLYYEPVGELAQSRLKKLETDDGLAGRLWDWTEEALEGF